MEIRAVGQISCEQQYSEEMGWEGYSIWFLVIFAPEQQYCKYNRNNRRLKVVCSSVYEDESLFIYGIIIIKQTQWQPV